MLDVEFPGWRGCTGSVVLRSVGCTNKFSVTLFGNRLCENIQSMGHSSGGHSCSQHASSKLASLTCAVIDLLDQHLVTFNLRDG